VVAWDTIEGTNGTAGTNRTVWGTGGGRSRHAARARFGRLRHGVRKALRRAAKRGVRPASGRGWGWCASERSHPRVDLLSSTRAAPEGGSEEGVLARGKSSTMPSVRLAKVCFDRGSEERVIRA